MKHEIRRKRMARLLAAVLVTAAAASLLALPAAARETGRTVLQDSYYYPDDPDMAKVPGLTYYCAGHGSKMVEYYVEEENAPLREIPGVVERVGDKLRYIKGYYCPDCYGQFASGRAVPGRSYNANKSKEELGIEGVALSDYFQYLSEHDLAFLSDCGFYYGEKDDMENMPSTGGSGNGGKTYAPTFDESASAMPNGNSLFTKALPEPIAKLPDTDDPIGNWDVAEAWTFYQFYYTGMRQIVNKPSSADDPAWETVRDMTRIYYMQRQMDNQVYACRVDNTLNYYRYDFSKLADWRITEVMVEYATGEVCGYATYVGTDSEVAVPEKINIPVYGDVKVVGLDVENHGLTKVYVNDNVTCIRRLSSVNLEEVSGCKNLEYIEKYAFQNDVSLTVLPEMPKLDWIAMGAFEGCISLRDIKLPDDLTFIDFTAFGWYDTVIGNYDIGMDVDSWQSFQYLRDLSDNDRILGLTLYAKKGSTTYKLLDALINQNDALTPELDEGGKPTFRSYSESIYLMSGDEVKYFTSNWNLKSSGDYKGSIASTDKDVDDSTGGRLGEYGEGEASWDPKKLVKKGAVTGGLLLTLTATAGVAGYEASKANSSQQDDQKAPDSGDTGKSGWGNRLTYEENVDNNKLIFDFLGLVGEEIEHMGAVGKAGKALIEGADKIQKFLDAYAQTGDMLEALAKLDFSDMTAGKLVGGLTEAAPGVAPWDAATGVFLGNSPIGDAVSIGANAEHGIDFILDMCRAVAGEAQKNPTAPAGTQYPGVFGVDEFCRNIAEGAYGENLKNLGLTGDLLFTGGSIGQTWDGIFGEEGIGFWNFVYNTMDTLGEKSADNNVVLGGLRNWVSKNVHDFYAGR